MRRLGIVPAVILALLPSAVKVPLYRMLYGYRIGRNVRIGLTPFVGVKRCRIGDGATIGSLNAFWRIEELEIGERAKIGFLNLFRGGLKITIGKYATILRLNVLNSIPEADPVNPTTPVIDLGPGAFVTTGHRLDFTDRITIGPHAVIGGRGSSFWTHNRQRTRPITIGAHCYIGSEVRAAPGTEVADLCIVSLGSVLMGRFKDPRSLILGNPAEIKRPLHTSELYLTIRKTRSDIPDAVARAFLPADLQASAEEILSSPA